MISVHRLQRVVTGALLGLVLAAAPVMATGQQAVDPVPTRERARMNQQVFDQVWSQVRRDYYDPALHGVDWGAARTRYRPQALRAADDRALYRVLDNMLDLLDDEHANAASPAVTRRNDRLRSRRAAIGVTMRPDPAHDGVYVVERVRDDSPAGHAGVAPGWRIDTNVPGSWHPELDVIAGHRVTLSATDEEGMAHAVELTPVVLDPLPPFVADRSRPGVVVLRIDGFETGLGQWMGAQLAQTPADTDVVVDLRGNAGGRMLEAEAVLSCFLPANQAWAVRRDRRGRDQTLRAGGGCGSNAGPVANDLAILVDGNSRSAAELTPAALQEANRALIVGSPTPGSVLISQETRLPDGGKLTLSRSDYITARGVRLEKRGVTPDVEASTSRADRRAGRDPALDAAIAALNAEARAGDAPSL